MKNRSRRSPGGHRKPKIDENHRNIAQSSLGERVARKKLDVFAPGRDLPSNFVASARYRVLLADLSGILELPWRFAGRSLGVPGTP